MRRPAPIEIDQADDRNAGGVKTKDVRRRECFCPFGARGQTVRRRELSQHDRGRLVDEITPRHAEDGVFTLPFRRQSLLYRERANSHSLHFRQRFLPQRMLPHRWLS